MDKRPKRLCRKPVRYKTTSSSHNDSNRLQVVRRRMLIPSDNVHDDIQAVRAAYMQFTAEGALDRTERDTIPIPGIPPPTHIPLMSSTYNNYPTHDTCDSQPESQDNTYPTYTTLMPFSPTTSSNCVPILPIRNPSSSHTAMNETPGLLANTKAQSVFPTTSTFTRSSCGYMPLDSSSVASSFTPSSVSISIPTAKTSHTVPFNGSLATAAATTTKILQDNASGDSLSCRGIALSTAPLDYCDPPVRQPLLSHSISTAADRTRVSHTVSSSYVLRPSKINSPYTTSVASASTSSITHSLTSSHALPSMNPTRLATSASSLRPYVPINISAALPPPPNNDAGMPAQRNIDAASHALRDNPAGLRIPLAVVNDAQVRIGGNVDNALTRINNRLESIERTLRSQRRRGVVPKPGYLPFRRVEDILNFNEADQDTYEQLVQYLEYVGGFTLKEVCNLSMKELIVDRTTQRFTWWGRDIGRAVKPIPFYDTVLAGAIHDAASNNAHFRAPTQRDFCMHMREAIRIAKQRVRNNERPNRAPRRNEGIRRHQEEQAAQLFPHRGMEENSGSDSGAE